MSTLTERVRRRLCRLHQERGDGECFCLTRGDEADPYSYPHCVSGMFAAEAEAAIREVLAYLPEASVQAAYQAIGSTIMRSTPEHEFRQLVRLFTRAVAREHGIDPPPEEQQP